MNEGNIIILINMSRVGLLGKTALHWAAAVNNVDAVLTLLQRDVNKDAQDSRDQTPLFLAPREGSYEAVKVLLDHYANRDITDHMDRLPRTIAYDRMHHDIVGLLDDYFPDSPLGTGAGYQSATGSLLPSYLNASDTKSKQKRQTKKNAAMGKGLTAESTSLLHGCKQATVHLPPAKKSKAKAAMQTQPQCDPPLSGSLDRALSIGTISPLDFAEAINFELPPSYESACNEHDLVMSEPNISTISSGSLQFSAAAARNQYNSDSLASDPLYQNINHSSFMFDAPPQMNNVLPSSSDWLADLIHPSLHGSNYQLSSDSSVQQQQQAMAGLFGPAAAGATTTSAGLTQSYMPYASSAQGCSSAFSGPNTQSPSSGSIHSMASLRKKALPLSPTHIQAMQQHHAQRNRVSSQSSPPQQQQQHHSQNPMTGYSQPYMSDQVQGWMGQSLLPNQQPQQPLVHSRHCLHHYPTPPSQHGSETMSHLMQGYLPEHFLTPSPDSPGQWSSSSPTPAQSDWSEGISSPTQPIHQLPTNGRAVPKIEGIFM